MPASRSWIEAALVLIVGRLSSSQEALELVRELQALPGANASVRVTLERMETQLLGESDAEAKP